MAIAENTQKKRPIPKGPGDAGWQAHKSSTTREQILDAAIRCIVELGYANTTTTKIAELAGLSRGATLHHFPSRLEIIRAAVDYIHQKRLRAFKKSVISTPKDANHVSMAVHAYWSQIKHPFFIVFFELSVAARHDDDLADILRPAQKAYDEEWYKTAQELYPEWQSDPEAFDLALNLSQQLLEGMAVSHLTHAREFNQEALLNYLEDSIRTLAP